MFFINYFNICDLGKWLNDFQWNFVSIYPLEENADDATCLCSVAKLLFVRDNTRMITMSAARWQRNNSVKTAISWVWFTTTGRAILRCRADKTPCSIVSEHSSQCGQGIQISQHVWDNCLHCIGMRVNQPLTCLRYVTSVGYSDFYIETLHHNY